MQNCDSLTGERPSGAVTPHGAEAPDCGPACYAGGSIAGERITTLSIRHQCDDYDSYRAARVKSLFNAENGCNFNLDVEIDLSGEWNIGVVVGPSGSGKTSVGRRIFGENTEIHDYY